MSTRRIFLKQATTAAALSALTARDLRRRWWMAPSELLPEPDETLLRALALAAVDAARSAGASFADVRVLADRTLRLGGRLSIAQGRRPVMSPPELTMGTGYGVRALVDGAWGFASASESSTDAVAQAARAAVVAARANRPRHRQGLDLAPSPVVSNGTWTTPIEQDPFGVPIHEQCEVALGAIAEASKVREVIIALAGFEWRRPTSVFASSEGSLIVQHITLGFPSGVVAAILDPETYSGSSGSAGAGLPYGGYGYEAAHAATLAAELRAAADRSVALAKATANPRPAEVGRFDVVFGPLAVAALVAQTLGDALNAERALGYQANEVGTSFAAPPVEMMGRSQVGSKLLTVGADRTRPHGAASIGWDDEGVASREFTLVRDGVIADYLTGRQTAAELAPAYRAAGAPVQSNGCMRRLQPATLLPNLTIEPGPGATTAEDLIAGTKRGLYVERAFVSADQQVINVQSNGLRHPEVREIVNGKLGAYVKDAAFQFLTPSFWKNLDGIGGRASAKVTPVPSDAMSPFTTSTVEAVPIRVRQVNILNVGRTA